MKRTYLKQDQIVNALRGGEMICAENVEYVSNRGRLIYSAMRYKVDGVGFIHPSTISSMIRKRIINGPNTDKSICYTLIQTP